MCKKLASSYVDAIGSLRVWPRATPEPRCLGEPSAKIRNGRRFGMSDRHHRLEKLRKQEERIRHSLT
jgi:hypothetical protein